MTYYDIARIEKLPKPNQVDIQFLKSKMKKRAILRYYNRYHVSFLDAVKVFNYLEEKVGLENL